MVKVEYIGVTKSVYGAATNTPYGYRKAGAIFKIWQRDLAVMGDEFKAVDL